MKSSHVLLFAFPRNCFATVLIISALSSPSHAQKYFPILFQRTVYVDNLGMPGAWWANPAASADMVDPTFVTSNVLPLGDSLLLSTARLFLPFKSYPLVFGASILGAGGYKPGTSRTDASAQGVTYTSSFAFAHPRFQFGLSLRTKAFGAVGILTTFGSDPVSVSYERTENKLSPGISAGWYSPTVLHTVRFAASAVVIRHETARVFYEKSAKFSFLATVLDSIIMASGDYTLSFAEGFGVLYPKDSFYEAAKVMISCKINKALAVMAGYSSDIGDYYTNNRLIHAGIEARQNDLSPFLGGYDVGVWLGSDWRLLHRVWVGANLKGLKRTD